MIWRKKLLGLTASGAAAAAALALEGGLLMLLILDVHKKSAPKCASLKQASCLAHWWSR
jgi:hypothetical protein